MTTKSVSGEQNEKKISVRHHFVDLGAQVINLPAVDLLHDVLLVGQIADGRPTLVLELDVRVAHKVMVARLPRLPVRAHERHARPLDHGQHLLGFALDADLRFRLLDRRRVVHVFVAGTNFLQLLTQPVAQKPYKNETP